MAARLPGWPGPIADPAADAELLRRFAAARDEAAFEALVWRHGAAVRAVCRFALGNAADADDAFQATFLVLARKAASVRDPASVGRWLVAVAGRVARKARSRRERFPTATEDLAVIPARPAPTPDDTGAVFDEVAKLPEKYRLPMFLVYAAGHTTADAAAILGTPKGTLLTRLAWARKVLAGRLVARGLAPAVAAATVVPLDPQLVRATVTAAAAYAAGIASLSPAVPLSDGVIRSMTAAKFTTAAGVLCAAVALTGLGIGAGALTAADPPGKKPLAEVAPAVPAPQPSKTKAPPATGTRPPLVLSEPVPPDRDPAVLQEMADRIQELQRALDTERSRKLPPPVNETPAMAMIPPTPTAPAPKPMNPKAGVKEFVIGRPVGVWHRAAGSHRFQMKFSDADSRLTVANTVVTPNGPVLVQIEADYSVGKDGVIFGYITGIETSGGGVLDHLIDTPFSFRFRADDNVLTVKDVKLAGVGKDDTVLFATGRYTDQAVPPTVPAIAPPQLPNAPVPTKRPTPVDGPPPVPAADPGPTPINPPKKGDPRPSLPNDTLPSIPKGEAAAVPTADSAQAVKYVLKREIVVNPDGSYTYKNYYVPEIPAVPAGIDTFTRPDGSNRLLGPTKQQPIPSPVPFENENPQRSSASS